MQSKANRVMGSIAFVAAVSAFTFLPINAASAAPYDGAQFQADTCKHGYHLGTGPAGPNAYWTNCTGVAQKIRVNKAMSPDVDRCVGPESTVLLGSTSGTGAVRGAKVITGSC
ncbi:DUF6355 family natural product biosynthesis protein [Nocardia thailandica]